MLDDPKAREQIAGDLASSLAAAANKAATAAAVGTGINVPKIDGNDPALRSAVASALADTRVTRNVTDALAAEHANLLGVEPKQPATIDTALLIDVVTRGLGAANPALARQLTAAAPKSIALPDIEIPLARQVRGFASTAVPRLALLALVLVGAAFLLGDRGRVLQRAGTWAFGAGLLWVAIPRVLIWATETWAPGNAAVVRALLLGATGVVTAMAMCLVVIGAASIIGGLLLQRVASMRREAGGSAAGRRDSWGGATARPMTPGWRTFTGRDMPANGPTADIETLLDRLDGIMLTGSRSNVHPTYYDGPPHAEGTFEDQARDRDDLQVGRERGGG